MSKEAVMIEAHMPQDWKDARIYPMYDVHIGAPEHDSAALTQYVKAIQDDPRGLVILGGDIVDNATRNSVGSVYDAPMSPRDQKRMAADMLAPIRDKIIAIVNGNHELRTYKESGQDITYDIACKLDIEDRYRENLAFVKLTLGKDGKNNRVSYHICAGHGSGGGMYIGSSINKTENFLYALDGVDIMITGHVHKKGVSRPTKLVFDPRNNMVTQREMLNVVCGAWMQYGGYAARMLLRPGGVGAAKVTLDGTRKAFEAVV